MPICINTRILLMKTKPTMYLLYLYQGRLTASQLCQVASWNADVEVDCKVFCRCATIIAKWNTVFKFVNLVYKSSKSRTIAVADVALHWNEPASGNTIFYCICKNNYGHHLDLKRHAFCKCHLRYEAVSCY